MQNFIFRVCRFPFLLQTLTVCKNGRAHKALRKQQIQIFRFRHLFGANCKVFQVMFVKMVGVVVFGGDHVDVDVDDVGDVGDVDDVDGVDGVDDVDWAEQHVERIIDDETLIT